MVSSETSQPDHYATLGLAPGATSKDVEDAFHAKVREHLAHSNVAEKPIRERARQVGLAYETLRDPAKRRAYDESRAAAAEADGALGPNGAAEVRPPPIMFTPRQPPDRRVDEALAAPSEPAATPAEPEPAAIVAPVPADPVDAQPDAAVTPVEPEAPRVDSIPDADPYRGEPDEAYPPTADEPAEDGAAYRATTVPAATSTIIDDEPAADETDIAPWQPRRPSGMHRGALAAAAVVVALGIGGLLLARVGSHSGRAPVQAVLPVAVQADHAPTGPAQTVETPLQPGGAPTAPRPDSAQQAAAGTQTPVAANPGSTAATRVPPDASTAAPVTSAPARTLQVKLPPPAAPSASASAAVAAPPPAPAPVVAPPPQPAPAPAPQARSVQPFPRWLGGGLMNSDNPGGQYQGTVGVRFTVEPSGRVSDCRPVASSGNPALDATTCSLVEQRLRFSPALNAQGQPIATEVRTSYTWGRMTRRR